MFACPLYLVAVPPSTDSFVVMSNGDSAEGTEERSDLNVKDVCQAPLKFSSRQKHLDQTHQGTDIPRIDLNTCILLEKSTLGNKLCIILNHGWTNTEKQIQRLIKRKRCTKTSHTVYWISYFWAVQCENIKNKQTPKQNKKDQDYYKNKRFSWIKIIIADSHSFCKLGSRCLSTQFDTN